jgi:twitching motility protein PilI
VARQISLREFQRELAARLAEARAATTPNVRLGVQAGRRYWLIRLDDAGEVLPVPEVTPVPLTRSWYRGLANIRGNLASVVDLAAFMGGEPTLVTPDCRLVLIADRYGSHSGLLVARMVGLRNLSALERCPPVADRAWVGACYGEGGERTWHELSVASLVADDGYLDVSM